MAMGIKRPGFQLLSLAPTELRNPNLQYKPNDDSPCFLPDQIGIYLRIYLPVFVFTLAAVFMTNLCCWRSGRRGAANRHRLTTRPSKDSGEGWRRASPPRRDVESYLPSPVSAGSGEEKGFNKPSRKQSLAPTLLFCFFPRQTRRSAFVNCFLDIRDIAIYPISIFVILSYWFS